MTGVSGSGKTTLVLESLLPALRAAIDGTALPAHVGSISAQGIRQSKLIDATPIGVNVRSTVATYANVHDDLRKAFAKTARREGRGHEGGRLLVQHGQAALSRNATARVRSASTCSSCPTWTCRVPRAGEAAMRRPPLQSGAPRRRRGRTGRSQRTRCPSSWTWTSRRRFGRQPT